MDGLLRAVLLVAHEALRNDDDAAAHAGEPAVLREAPKLDRAITRAFDFEDRARHRGVLDEGLVGGVVEDDRAVRTGVGDPGFELLARGGAAGRVVRVAEVNEIDRLTRDLWHEAVFRGALEVVEAGVGAVFVRFASVAGHDVCIDVNGIHRVCDGDLVPGTEDVEDVAGVALAAVGDEDLIGVDLDAACLEVVLCDGVAQEVVTLFRAIAAEGGAVAHFIDGFVHGIAHGLGQRLGHIADAATDQALRGVRVRLREDFHATCDFREEVTGFELVVVFVDVGHGVGKRAASVARVGVDATQRWPFTAARRLD